MTPSPSDPEDEIRFLKDSFRLLRDNIETELLEHGWAVADLGVGDEEPLEWFWPPTAPVGYGGLPEWSDEAIQHRPHLYGPRHSPWTVPTRLTKTADRWRLEYGEAIAQEPDQAQEYAEDAALLDDLERIEWWPMRVEEAKRIQAERVMHTTHADAYDQHSLGFTLRTEPYDSRMNELRDRIWSEKPVRMGDPEAWK